MFWKAFDAFIVNGKYEQFKELASGYGITDPDFFLYLIVSFCHDSKYYKLRKRPPRGYTLTDIIRFFRDGGNLTKKLKAIFDHDHADDCHDILYSLVVISPSYAGLFELYEKYKNEAKISENDRGTIRALFKAVIADKHFKENYKDLLFLSPMSVYATGDKNIPEDRHIIIAYLYTWYHKRYGVSRQKFSELLKRLSNAKIISVYFYKNDAYGKWLVDQRYFSLTKTIVKRYPNFEKWLDHFEDIDYKKLMKSVYPPSGNASNRHQDNIGISEDA